MSTLDESQARIRERNPHLGDPPLCGCGNECFAVQPIGPAFWSGRCPKCLKGRVTFYGRYEGQQPCPSCSKPMSGLGWKVKPHDCDATALNCNHSEFWLGPYGNCEDCSTEQVALAVEERIASEFMRMADDYLPLNDGKAWDIWEWTAELARRIRAGEFTSPPDTEPPF